MLKKLYTLAQTEKIFMHTFYVFVIKKTTVKAFLIINI